MKHSTFSKNRAGFTLVELLVAMAITLVLLGTLVYLTGVSIDTYQDSRNDVRASRQAKGVLETIAKDFESMVLRRDGSLDEWFYAGAETSSLQGPTADKEIPNTSRIIFFTGATDRYNGKIGTGDDKGGDVSAVSYRLVYKDQISGGPPTSEGDFPVFSMYRHLVDPDEAFELLSVEDLEQASDTKFSEAEDLAADNFLMENIYEFTVTLIIEVNMTTPSGGTVAHTVRATLKPDGVTELKLRGNGIDYTGTVELPNGINIDNVKAGRIMGAEVSITVLSDRGLTLAQRSGISREELVRKHGYHYTKSIVTPRP